MKVLFVHTFYQQPGGEDQVFAAESALVERNGNSVIQFTAHNADFADRSAANMAVDTIWNRRVFGQLKELVDAERPHIVHFHNTFPFMSPAAYWAVRRAGSAVVQTLHNYRLICSNAMLFRDGHPCEDCVPRRVRWPGVVHRCYRSALAPSGVVTTMLGVHHAIGTWHRAVDAYIVLSEFARERFERGGLPSSRLFTKPNFLADDPGVGNGQGRYALFVGRLVPEKGVRTLVEAWGSKIPGVPLRVVGDGPMADDFSNPTDGTIEMLGPQPNARVRELMRAATVLVMPSLWYEGLPVTLIEAFATGLPVVASSVGALRSLVESGRTGVLVEPGNPSELARAVSELIHDPARLAEMRAAARAEYERAYTAERNYKRLLDIYGAALQHRRAAA